MQSLITVLVASSLIIPTHAASVHARHQDFHAKKEAPAYAPSSIEMPTNTSSCGCYTYTTTWYGEAGLVPDTKTHSSNSSTSVAALTTSTESSSPTTYAETTISANEVAASAPVPKVISSYVATSTNTTMSSVYATYISSSNSSATSSTVKTSSAAQSYKPTSSSSSSAWVAPTYYSLSSSYTASSSSVVSSSASPSATSGSSGAIAPSGDQWAFCYTPYDKSGNCKSASDVASDVAAIKAKGFTTVRLYATDCSGPENVGAAAAENGLKVVLGIYIDESGIGSNTDEQIDTLTQWGEDKWDMVEMVVAGNEAVFYGYASASDLAGFVLDVKSKFQAAGYSGPVGTTEPLGTFQENADVLCAAVDYAGANIHPYFNTDVTADTAGNFVAQQLDDLAAACNNEKEAYNLESGWPSSGLANGQAVPGASEQKIAIQGILSAAGRKSAVFSFENDAWKAPGPFDVEQYWGCADLFDG